MHRLTHSAAPTNHDSTNSPEQQYQQPGTRVPTHAICQSAEDRWTWADKELNSYSFLTPEEARGLEFDSVVVVEPAIFRANSGSDGRLYTSLTRANLELVVVHSRPLPTALAREAQRLTLENPFAP